MAPPKPPTAASNPYAAPHSGSETSPTTSPEHSSKQEDSDPNYTPNYEEPAKVAGIQSAAVKHAVIVAAISGLVEFFIFLPDYDPVVILITKFYRSPTFCAGVEFRGTVSIVLIKILLLVIDFNNH